MSDSQRHVLPSSMDSHTDFMAGCRALFSGIEKTSARHSDRTVGGCSEARETALTRSFHRRWTAASMYPVRPDAVPERPRLHRRRASSSGAQPDAFFSEASYASNERWVHAAATPRVFREPRRLRRWENPSIRTSGQLQVCPESRDRISSTRPKGQTWLSRPPEYATSNSPSPRAERRPPMIKLGLPADRGDRLDMRTGHT